MMQRAAARCLNIRSVPANARLLVSSRARAAAAAPMQASKASDDDKLALIRDVRAPFA